MKNSSRLRRRIILRPCARISTLKKPFVTGSLRPTFGSGLINGEKSKHYMKSSCQQLKNKNLFPRKTTRAAPKSLLKSQDFAESLET